MQVTPARLKKMTDIMAGVLGNVLSYTDEPEGELMRTPNSSKFAINKTAKIISFSGGVADLIYNKENDVYKYNDLGVSLAASIRESKWYRDFEVINSKETIRATVVGAGIYTTIVSGSTINYNRNLFPIKNIPALVVDRSTENGLYSGDSSRLEESLKWFEKQTNAKKTVMCFEGKKKTSYEELCNMAEAIVKAVEKIFKADIPLLIITENDMAKSLGQTIEGYLHEQRDVVCIDKIVSKQGDYIDIGKPLMDGMAVPVVVKTLIFK